MKYMLRANFLVDTWILEVFGGTIHVMGGIGGPLRWIRLVTKMLASIYEDRLR